jgi:hypothetical protein
MSTATTTTLNEDMSLIYYNTDTGYGSFQSLWNLVKKIHKRKYKWKDVLAWYKRQSVSQLFVARKVKFSKITCPFGTGGCLQADLMDISKYKGHNKHRKFILTVIDVNSRYLFMRDITTKSAKNVSAALSEIFQEISNNHIIATLTTDDGKEFTNNVVKKLLVTNNITHYVTNSSKSTANHPTVTAIVERVHRTIWGALSKYFTAHDTFVFVDKLQSFVKNYNTRIHSSLEGLSPHQKYNDSANIVTSTKVVLNDLNVGVHVRIRRKIDLVAKKSTTPKLSRETYEITAITGSKHILKNTKSGVLLKRTYINRELVKIDKETQDGPKLERVRKVVSETEKKQKKRNRRARLRKILEG